MQHCRQPLSGLPHKFWSSQTAWMSAALWQPSLQGFAISWRSTTGEHERQCMPLQQGKVRVQMQSGLLGTPLWQVFSSRVWGLLTQGGVPCVKPSQLRAIEAGSKGPPAAHPTDQARPEPVTPTPTYSHANTQCRGVTKALALLSLRATGGLKAPVCAGDCWAVHRSDVHQSRSSPHVNPSPDKGRL